MSSARPLKLARVILDVERGPLACAPLVGSDEAALRAEREQVRAMRPDLLEWRIDHFAPIADTASGVRMIGSFHDFARKPPRAELVARFVAMQAGGADIARVAVMPHDLHDVLTLLQATLEARKRLDLPLISMSMGPLGALTRLCGWVFGSSVSFVVGAEASAPGQLPIADLRAMVEVLRRAMDDR